MSREDPHTTTGEPDPAYDEEQARGFRSQFALRRERQKRVGKLFAGLVGALVGLGTLLRLPEAYWVPAVGAVALTGLVFSLANWKCPACGSRLTTRGSTHACPECGLALE